MLNTNIDGKQKIMFGLTSIKVGMYLRVVLCVSRTFGITFSLEIRNDLSNTLEVCVHMYRVWVVAMPTWCVRKQTLI